MNHDTQYIRTSKTIPDSPYSAVVERWLYASSRNESDAAPHVPFTRNATPVTTSYKCGKKQHGFIRLLGLHFSLIVLMCTQQLAGQPATVITFTHDNGVYIRWKVDRATIPTGYNLYRKSEIEDEWNLVSPQPIRRMKSLNALRSVLGYQTPMYLKLFSSDDPPRDIEDAAYSKVFSDKKSNAFLNLLSFANTGIAIALGEFFVDKNPDRSNPNRYRVTVLTAQGEAEIGVSDPVDAQTHGVVPDVTGITAQVADARVTLTWDRDPEHVKHGTVATFNVYRASSLLGDYEKINTAPLLPIDFTATASPPTMSTSQNFTDRFLENGLSYFYYLKAVNTFGVEGPQSVTVEAIPIDTTAPPAPSNVHATLMGASVMLEWDRDVSQRSEFYNVRKSMVNPEAFVDLGIVKHGDTDPVFIDGNVKEGVFHYYVVSARTSGGKKSKESDIVSVFIPDMTPPAKPGGLVAKAEKGDIALRWNPNTEIDLRGYMVERAADEKFVASLRLTGKPITGSIYFDTVSTDLQSTFGYIVYAVDNSDNRSQPSEMVKVRTWDELPPAVPIITALDLSDSVAVIDWTPVIEEDFSHYHIYRSENDSKHFRKKPTVRTNRYHDTLSAFGRNYYAVSSVDSLGNESHRSRAVSILHEGRTAPKPPRKGTATRRQESIEVTWEESESASVFAYQLVRKRTSDGRVTQLGEVKPPTLRWSDKEADPEKQYLYLIRARDAWWRMSEVLEVRYKPAGK